MARWVVFPLSIGRLGAQAMGLALFLLAGCTASFSSSAPVMDRTWLLTRKFHQVSTGDTLYSVAREYGQAVADLAALNQLTPPWTLHPGQQLLLVDLDDDLAQQESRLTTRKKDVFSSSQGISNGVESTPWDRSDLRAGSFLKPVVQKAQWFWPVRGHVLTRFSIDKKRYTGIAIAGSMGEAVRATASGKVVYSGAGLVGYGYLVIVRHAGRYISTYGHNSRLLVRRGEWVQAGQKIAELGSTGTDSPKLYFEIRHKGVPVDPLGLLPGL